jgi:hypothetical protein
LLQNYYVKYLLAIFSIVGGYLALILFDNLHNPAFQTFCLFKWMTGIPCPGCGMGRATLALLQGNVPLSLYYNILCIPFSISILISLVWAGLDITRGKNTFFKFIKQNIPVNYKFLLFGLLGITWILNIIHLS